MNAPDIHNPSGRTFLARVALESYAGGLRNQARTRTYAGPENADARANLRAWADSAEALAQALQTSDLVIDEPFES